MIQTRIKSRERSNESSSFSNNLVKRQSFRALRGGGRGLPLFCTQPRFACSLPPPKIKSWLRAWEGCVLPHASTTVVALIHCRKYFGTYHPPQPRIQIDTLGGVTGVYQHSRVGLYMFVTFSSSLCWHKVTHVSLSMWC